MEGKFKGLCISIKEGEGFYLNDVRVVLDDLDLELERAVFSVHSDDFRYPLSFVLTPDMGFYKLSQEELVNVISPCKVKLELVEGLKKTVKVTIDAPRSVLILRDVLYQRAKAEEQERSKNSKVEYKVTPQCKKKCALLFTDDFTDDDLTHLLEKAKPTDHQLGNFRYSDLVFSVKGTTILDLHLIPELD